MRRAAGKRQSLAAEVNSSDAGATTRVARPRGSVPPLQRGDRRRPKGARARSVVGALPYVGPLVVAVIALVIEPAVVGLSRSFFNWQPGSASPFVGISNFKHLADSATFRTILSNEAVYLTGLPIWTLLPLVIAVFLFSGVRFAGLVRTLIFVPALVSPALLGIMFTPILAPAGLVNTTLTKVGLGTLAHPWLESTSLVKPTVILILAWANVGLGVAIFTAALTGIRPDLIDAANVAGATSWQRLRYVILPGVRRTLVLWMAFQALGVFLFLFGLIFALTAGGPGNASTSIDYDVFTNAITNGLFGVGAAESVYLLVIVVLIAACAWTIGRRWSHE
jgi:multiple sugar transport system permease protein